MKEAKWQKTLKELWPNLYGHKFGEAISGNLWGINPGGGRFYAENRNWMSTTEKVARLADTPGITHIEAHDTDILDLRLGEDAKDGYGDISEAAKMDLLKNCVEDLAALCEQKGLKVGMFTMNMFNSDKRFICGNVDSRVDETRELAIARTKAGLTIAQQFGCVYVRWNGTAGIDGPFGAFHQQSEGHIWDSTVEILEWHHSEHGDKAVPLCDENKLEEPKWKMYNAVAQACVALGWRLRCEKPDVAHLYRTNIEVGHEVMAKLNPAMSYGHSMANNMLGHVHLNDQGTDGPAYDRDLPFMSQDPLGGLDVLWQLNKGGYGGILGIDVQPLPGDSDEQAVESIALSAQNVLWGVKQLGKIDEGQLAALQTAHNQSGISKYTLSTLLGVGATG